MQRIRPIQTKTSGCGRRVRRFSGCPGGESRRRKVSASVLQTAGLRCILWSRSGLEKTPDRSPLPGAATGTEIWKNLCVEQKNQEVSAMGNSSPHRGARIAAAAAGVGALAGYVVWENRALQLSSVTVGSGRLPGSFNGFRIALVSDLHSTSFGRENSRLLAMVEETRPDMIALTGDIADGLSDKISMVLRFADRAVQIAPVMYVPGNHEASLVQYEELEQGLKMLGVAVLVNGAVYMDRGDGPVTILGLKDPRFGGSRRQADERRYAAEHLHQLKEAAQGFTILLSHRPELFDLYVDEGIDLVLSGHAHGGQFRLPLIGGVFCTQQGFFPRYTDGVYRDGGTQMVVSRGLGNTKHIPRLNNRPEVVLVELSSREEEEEQEQ